MTDLAFLQLYWDLMNRKTGDVGRVAFEVQKPAYDFVTPIEQPFPRSTPEEQGVDSSYLASFITELEHTPAICMHQVLIVRNEHVIYEGSFDPYEPGVWHATYSMCKSFTGMAIGLLIDDGKLSLDSKVLDILEPQGGGLLGGLGLGLVSTALNRAKYGDLTIRDLLVMSSGSSFNEVGAISGNDWEKSFFDSSVKFTPGTKFEYNSMNSFILSCVVTALTGMSMFDFLKARLFQPMGITKVFWEHSPKGITKGGWGMFLLPEDAAKLGLLYMNKGMWKGEQLISAAWCEEATKPQKETGRKDNPWYGYHCWIGPLPGSFMYNGMLGQNVYCYPSLKTIVVVNAGNTEVFADGTMTKLIRKYFCEGFEPSDQRLPANEGGRRQLEMVRKECMGDVTQVPRISRGGWNVRLKSDARAAGGNIVTAFDRGRRGPQQDRLFRHLNGKTFDMEAGDVGLFPIMLQVVHNNYTDGISQLTFELEDGVLFLNFLEGTTNHRVPVGFGKGRHTAVNFHGEEYAIGTTGRFAYNEDHMPVLTVEISYTEEACTREVKIIFVSEEELLLIWDESPTNVIAGGAMAMITTGSGNTNPIFTGMVNRINPELIAEATRSAIHPRVKAHLRKPAGAEAEGEE